MKTKKIIELELKYLIDVQKKDIEKELENIYSNKIYMLRNIGLYDCARAFDLIDARIKTLEWVLSNKF